MPEMRTQDALDRERALDVERSFIVQAPAGSGKTGLLIQRVLALLTRVDKPEEVVAITFTRKAAAEMRVRILEALEMALGDAPAEDYLRTTWTLARAVAKRDEELGWGLALNPSRLRLMTIDALCASLVRQMPLLSQFGANPKITTRAERLYQRAARRLLASLENPTGVASSLTTLLGHLDNNLQRTEALLVRMLRGRDRWLGHVAGVDRSDLDRPILEKALSDCVAEGLMRVEQAVPADSIDEIVDLAAYAAGNCDANSPLAACLRMDALPYAAADHLPMWRGLRYLLLKLDGKVRSTVTAREGFPAPSKTTDKDEKTLRGQFKQRATALFESIADNDELVSALGALDKLPPVSYRQEDWLMLQALKRVLPVAAAQLKVVFQESGEVDFTEVSHRALAAMGDNEQPSELALQLDYRIAHLLVDEFQDTSRSQFGLLSRLVAGWQPGDGRTLFLVGDPMQSIYRFRDADVGLFLYAREHGVQDIALEALHLTANFRSRPALVNFYNELFAGIFPPRESIARSAVTFSASQPARSASKHSGVAVHSFGHEDPDFEAQKISEIISDAQRASPTGNIAILVRGRAHLKAILPALSARGLRYQAVEIDALKEQPVVRDLWALTRALLHLADRAAWLAVLRAPWCGLMLDDLFALCGGNPGLTVWELTINSERHQELSRDGGLRLARVKSVLAKSLADKGRRDLRRWVEGTWTALGGPACVETETQMANAQAYLSLLEDFENDGGFDNLGELERAVSALYAQPDASAGELLQVMTMHKAKGLEFDTVILPGLARGSANDDRELLSWLERTTSDGHSQMLLAPIQATGEEDPIGRYIADVKRQCDRNEQRRLLYVAATRAREKLHILMQISSDDDGTLRAPRTNSLAALLWPQLQSQIGDGYMPSTPVVESAEVTYKERQLRRVPSEWMLPQAPQPKPWRSSETFIPEEAGPARQWAGDTARHVGTAVHRILQQAAVEGVDAWIGHWIDGLDQYLAKMLTVLGVGGGELDNAVSRAHSAVRNCLLDERGRWILARHNDARAEWALSGWLDGRLHNVVIDRTFIVDDGVRWIIDYKTGSHEGGSLDAFLDTEFERYRSQLELYARVVQRLDPRPIHLGLYFPLAQGWREWRFVTPETI